jgi:hypothetical protein
MIQGEQISPIGGIKMARSREEIQKELDDTIAGHRIK